MLCLALVIGVFSRRPFLHEHVFNLLFVMFLFLFYCVLFFDVIFARNISEAFCGLRRRRRGRRVRVEALAGVEERVVNGEHARPATLLFVRMYVCMCIYIYAYVYIYICICMCIYT